jgi:hypothetical protein
LSHPSAVPAFVSKHQARGRLRAAPGFSVKLTKQGKSRVSKAGKAGLPVKLGGTGVKGRTVVLKGPRRHR